MKDWKTQTHAEKKKSEGDKQTSKKKNLLFCAVN